MRPADTTPAPGPSSRQANPAKSPFVCQATGESSPPWKSSPTILLVEQRAHSSITLATGLTRATGWRVLFSQSSEEVSRHIATKKGNLKIIVITVGNDYGEALRMIRSVRKQAATGRIPCPRMLMLTLFPHSPDVPLMFERVGVHYLLRSSQEQVVETVKKLQWEDRTKKSLPTIIVRRGDGHIRTVMIKVGPFEREMRVGPRLRTLIEYLALHSRVEHTTEMIADALGVCRQTVKEYMFRLRSAFNAVFRDLNLGLAGENVFWTRKIDGGYVHGIRANIELQDE
jgi:DNA-binding NarL/FixJ family response regulator